MGLVFETTDKDGEGDEQENAAGEGDGLGPEWSVESIKASINAGGGEEVGTYFNIDCGVAFWRLWCRC